MPWIEIRLAAIDRKAGILGWSWQRLHQLKRINLRWGRWLHDQQKRLQKVKRVASSVQDLLSDDKDFKMCLNCEHIVQTWRRKWMLMEEESCKKLKWNWGNISYKSLAISLPSSAKHHTNTCAGHVLVNLIQPTLFISANQALHCHCTFTIEENINSLMHTPNAEGNTPLQLDSSPPGGYILRWGCKIENKHCKPTTPVPCVFTFRNFRWKLIICCCLLM